MNESRHCFKTPCGHYVNTVPVRKKGGIKEGQWQVRIRGPTIKTGQKRSGGFREKVIYSNPEIGNAIRIASNYLRIPFDSFTDLNAKPEPVPDTTQDVVSILSDIKDIVSVIRDSLVKPHRLLECNYNGTMYSVDPSDYKIYNNMGVFIGYWYNDRPHTI